MAAERRLSRAEPGTRPRPRFFTSDDAEIDVVGESKYQAALWSLVGPDFDPDGPGWTGRAVLMPERTNAYDPNAVRVLIKNRTVGYLNRATAASVQPAIQALEDAGYRVYVDCSLKGGFLRSDGTHASLGVTLHADARDVIAAAGVRGPSATQRRPKARAHTEQRRSGGGGCLRNGCLGVLGLGVLLIVLGQLVGGSGGATPTPAGNPEVYARIAAMTDCAALQQSFDTAFENHGRDRARGRHDLAVISTAYMGAADDRMRQIGCYGR